MTDANEALNSKSGKVAILVNTGRLIDPITDRHGLEYQVNTHKQGST